MKSDAQIQAEVALELAYDPNVSHEHIGVAVTDGIVALSGSVPSFTEKSSAEKTTWRVQGVKAIIEKIEVNLPEALKRDDQNIAKDIVDRFRWQASVPTEAVKVKVEDGWVDLAGEVDWECQKRAAEQVVEELAGVRGITSRVTIK